MLKQLYIKNFTLIDELNISLYPGFSVITGETGAGKSIILGAIGLLLGNRADSKAIKAGRDRCVIEAHFDLSRYGMQKFFDDNDIDYDADDTIIRRELTAAGKSRAFINDTPVPLTRMRELGEQLVDIHSQHQNLLLQKEDFQLNVVDIIAQDADQLKVYQKEYYAYHKAKELLEELKAEIAKNRENEEFMRFQHKELEDANLQEGELEQLEQEAETLSHSEDIKTALYEADSALSGDDDSILDKLKNATHHLENICDVYPSMADVAGRMQSSYIELKDIAQEISSSVDHVEFDPNRLDAINTRLDKLYTLQQKFHVETVTELIATRDRIAEQLSHIDNGDEDIEEKEKEVAALLVKAEKQAALLTSIRQKSAKAIEKEMKKVIKENPPIERYELPREEAIAFMKEKDEPYKVELIEDLPEDATISFYKQGDFTDLCAGPHLMSVKPIKAFKLTASSGAYWRGNENNKMLTRIYGTAYTKKADLEERLKYLEEIKLRDHNRLGREMELFTTVDVIGQGLPLLLPKGAKIIQTLQRWIEDLEDNEWGYVRTKTPLMAKSDLYKISGHWDHYKEGMFVLGDEENDKEVLALRPMTCPFQYYCYKNTQKSYRDLPYRMSETSTLFRNEDSGEMHGLTRVRQFTISEGHLIIRPDQTNDELKGCLHLAQYCLGVLGVQDDVTYRLSKWDPNNKEKYLGDDEYWETTQDAIRNILVDQGVPFVEAEGEAAFYGPKIDIQAKNVYGKEDTMITIQLDCAIAENFDMYYIDQNGEKQRPYVIHRTSMGCYERTLAWLIEKYAGKFPTWLCPEQVRVLPISEKFADYAEEVNKELKRNGILSTVDNRSEKIGYKIREARLQKLPYMLVVGAQEQETGKVSVRSRFAGDEGQKDLKDFISAICEEIRTKEIRQEVEE